MLQEEDWQTFISLSMEGHKPSHYSFLSGEALALEKKKGEKKLIDYLRPVANKSQKKKVSKPVVQNQLQYKEIHLTCYKEFQKYFKSIHKFVIPPSKDELNKLKLKCQLKEGLPHNVCLAEKCPFYLKEQKKRLNHHLAIWEHQLPFGFHKLLKMNHQKSRLDIFNLFMN